MTEFLKLNYRREGDILLVRLLDYNFNKYFEAKANVNDRKQMINLIKTLEQKGINFPINFLD